MKIKGADVVASKNTRMGNRRYLDEAELRRALLKAFERSKELDAFWSRENDTYVCVVLVKPWGKGSTRDMFGVEIRHPSFPVVNKALRELGLESTMKAKDVKVRAA